MKTKIKAFTLSEMLVVLLLTAIVVGIAFSILSLVQRQMGGIQNTLEDGSRFRQLKQQAAIDINTFQKFKLNSNKLHFSILKISFQKSVYPIFKQYMNGKLPIIEETWKAFSLWKNILSQILLLGNSYF